MAGWYIRRGEKVIGPVETDKLKESAAAGKLLPTDQLAKDAAGPWTEASKTKLFTTTAIVPQPERPPVAAEPELLSKLAPVINTSRTIVSKVTGGTVATWVAIARTLSVRAQRKHEIALAKIQAQALVDANRPPVPQQPERQRPAPQPQQPQQQVVFAPQVVQTTVVKVVNKNSNGGCCSGCAVLILLAIIFFVVAAALSDPSNQQKTPATQNRETGASGF
jgi:hypothetical protein